MPPHGKVCQWVLRELIPIKQLVNTVPYTTRRPEPVVHFFAEKNDMSNQFDSRLTQAPGVSDKNVLEIVYFRVKTA